MAGRDDASRSNGGRAGIYFRQVMVFYGVGALFIALIALLWLAANVLLVVFAGVLLAILLSEASWRLRRWLPLSRGPALGLVVLLAVVVLGLGGWLLAPGVAEQSNELFNKAIPRALQQLQASSQRYWPLPEVLARLPPAEAIASSAASMLAHAGVVFSGIFGAIAGALIVFFVGIYFAARPSVYVNAIVVLMPMAKRRRTREVLDAIGHTLAHWLMGKLVSMLIVGFVTAVGLAWLQVPLALVLGVLAGLLDFIPYLGPIMAGLPAVLIAFADSPTLALYVILLFIALQTAEGYFLLPLIERRTVSLPPALTIIMQTLLGTFFGLAGIALATPLTAVLAVLIAMLYVQDVLGDQVRIPGEHREAGGEDGEGGNR